MADQRFSKLVSDPRYRLPSRKESRTTVDPRFKRLYTDQDFRKKAKVDRYGRRVEPGSGRKELERLYRLDKGETKEKKSKSAEKVEREVVGSSDEESAEEDVVDEELVERKDPAREGGFSDSSSEEENASDEESEDEAELAEETAGQEQTEDIPMGEVSHRIAAVNLDWDNIRATDVMAVAASFAPNHGSIESVTIYPSEFGRERLQREELEGPPREIFASSTRDGTGDEDDEDEDSQDDEKIKRQLQEDQVNEGEEFNSAKLREYQLERLRYYYAVISCDTQLTAKHLYDAMDCREYLSTANFFDLRFIPDETSFDDDKPRDECRSLPDGYKPNEFRTEALTHSKVRLTWDDDDTSRKEVQKRAFSRAEMDENDLQAYIGSESSDAESVASRKSAAEERKVRKKETERKKMRAALGLAEQQQPKKSSAKREEPVGDMQITFTSGLSGSGKERKGVFENEPQDEESTRQRYVRKERERKLKRKERRKAGRSGGEPAAEADGGDDDNDVDAGAEDAGFNDPFFTDPSAYATAEKKAKNAEKKKKLAAHTAHDEASAKRRAELDLLMAPEDQQDEVKHFDMREIEKAEKVAKRTGKAKKKQKKSKDRIAAEDENGGLDGGFRVQTQDPRFKALFESHEFAIDPTNPKFKGTAGMRALLEEGRVRKRKTSESFEAGAGPGDGREKKSTKGGGADGNELEGLVARLKGGKKGRK